MSRVSRLLCSLLSLLTAGACRAGLEDSALGWPGVGDTVYTRVGMHFEASRGRYRGYSTNYVGLPKHLAPGTALTFAGVRGKTIELRDEHDTDYVIVFVEDHSMMPIEGWIQRHFAAAPPVVSAALTDDEREAIADSRCERGMSREAVFLAIGYPPKSLSPSIVDSMLTYEWKRFRRFRVRFDEQDRVARISRR